MISTYRYAHVIFDTVCLSVKRICLEILFFILQEGIQLKGMLGSSIYRQISIKLLYGCTVDILAEFIGNHLSFQL